METKNEKQEKIVLIEDMQQQVTAYNRKVQYIPLRFPMTKESRLVYAQLVPVQTPFRWASPLFRKLRARSFAIERKINIIDTRQWML